MSGKTLLVILIVVLLGVGAWWYFSQQSGGVTYQSNQAVTTAGNTTSNTSTSNVPNSASAISATQTSDADLDHDLITVDAEMNALNTDSAQADQGLNDKPISQTQ